MNDAVDAHQLIAAAEPVRQAEQKGAEQQPAEAQVLQAAFACGGASVMQRLSNHGLRHETHEVPLKSWAELLFLLACQAGAIARGQGLALGRSDPVAGLELACWREIAAQAVAVFHLHLQVVSAGGKVLRAPLGLSWQVSTTGLAKLGSLATMMW